MLNALYGDTDSLCHCKLEKYQYSYGSSTVTLHRCMGSCSPSCPGLDRLKRRKLLTRQLNSQISKYDEKAVYQCQPTVYGLKETTVKFNGKNLKFIQHTSCLCGLALGEASQNKKKKSSDESTRKTRPASFSRKQRHHKKMKQKKKQKVDN